MLTANPQDLLVLQDTVITLATADVPLALQARLDRAYDDRRAEKLSEELWVRRSQDGKPRLESVAQEVGRHEGLARTCRRRGGQDSRGPRRVLPL